MRSHNFVVVTVLQGEPAVLDFCPIPFDRKEVDIAHLERIYAKVEEYLPEIGQGEPQAPSLKLWLEEATPGECLLLSDTCAVWCVFGAGYFHQHHLERKVKTVVTMEDKVVHSQTDFDLKKPKARRKERKRETHKGQNAVRG